MGPVDSGVMRRAVSVAGVFSLVAALLVATPDPVLAVGGPVAVSVSPGSVAEDSGTGMVFTFTRAPDTVGAVTVNFSVGGDATFSTDYSQTGAATFAASSGTVDIPDGSDSATVTITPMSDGDVESDETVVLTVTAGTDYTVGAPDSASGTITNDDTFEVTVSRSPASVAEDSGSSITYTFTRTGGTSGPLTVNYRTTGSTASPGDYTPALSGSVTIPNTQASADVVITPTVDSDVEGDETVVLTIDPDAAYDVGTPN